MIDTSDMPDCVDLGTELVDLEQRIECIGLRATIAAQAAEIAKLREDEQDLRWVIHVRDEERAIGRVLRRVGAR